MKTTVSIIGCGWLGLALGESLVSKGYKVKGSSTSAQKLDKLAVVGIEPYLIALTPSCVSVRDFFNTDILIINIPPRNQNNDPDFHEKQLFFLKQKAIENGIKQLIFVSSTSVYPSNNSIVAEAEASLSGKSRGGISLLAMENIFTQEHQFSTTVIRYAGLIGPDRHPGNFFSADKLYQGGRVPVNLIHREDCIGIIEFIIAENLWDETFNACLPDHPTKEVFYTKAAKKLNKKPPSFQHDEGLNYKIVSADKLVKAGYQFKYKKLLETI